MARIRNVFEIIELYGHDENFVPHVSEEFTPTTAPAGSRQKIDVLLKEFSEACPFGIPRIRLIQLILSRPVILPEFESKVSILKIALSARRDWLIFVPDKNNSEFLMTSTTSERNCNISFRCLFLLLSLVVNLPTSTNSKQNHSSFFEVRLQRNKRQAFRRQDLQIEQFLGDGARACEVVWADDSVDLPSHTPNITSNKPDFVLFDSAIRLVQ